MFFAQWIQHVHGWHWLSLWPIGDIGSGIFTTGLLGVGWQYFDGQDSEVRDTARLKKVLRESAPEMRDAVINGFAFEPAVLAKVSTPETLDQIITNGLGIRLGDAGFAAEIYDDLRQQAIDAPERLHDARISIRLSPLPMGRGTAEGRASLYTVIVRWEYSLVPKYATRRFVCLSDLDEFRELEREKATSAWYFKPKARLQANDQEAFELVEFSVNGERRTIRRSAKANSQTYTITMPTSAMQDAQPVTVAYTYRTVTAADGHLLRLRVDQPTRGLSIQLDYGDTKISDVSIVGFIASSQPVRISRSPDRAAGSVAIELDGWAYPRSGVAFVWADLATSR